MKALDGSFPQPSGSAKGQEGQFNRTLLPVFFAEGHRKQSRHRQVRSLFDVVRPALSSADRGVAHLQRNQKNRLRAVVAPGMPKPREFLFVDSCPEEVPVRPNGC